MTSLSRITATIFICSFVGLLQGCTPRETIREVEVRVPTPCIDSLPEKPVMPLQEASPSEDIYSKTKKALAEIELRKGYEEKLEALYGPCTTK